MLADATPSARESVWGVAYAPGSGTRAVTAGDSGAVLVWDMRGGGARVVGAHAGAARDAAMLGGQILSVGDDGLLRAWDPEGGSSRCLASSVRPEEPLWSVACRSDGREALTGGADGLVQVWDLRRGRLAAVLRGHAATVLSISYSPGGRLVVTTSADATARVWDVPRRRCLAVLGGHQERTWDAAWRCDGGRLATASADGTVRVFATSDWRQVGLVDLAAPEPRAISYRAPGVAALRYLADGRLVLGVLDGTLRVVSSDLGTIQSIALPQPVLSLATHRSRPGEVLCGLFEGGVYRVDTASGSPPRPLKAR